MMSPVGWECTQGSAETKTLKKGGDMAVNWLMSNDKKNFKRLTFQESFLDRLQAKPNLQTKLKHKLKETGLMIENVL